MPLTITPDVLRALLDDELARAELRSDALLNRLLSRVEVERAQRSAVLAHQRWMKVMLGEPI